MKFRLTILLFSIYFAAQGQKLFDSCYNAALNEDSLKYCFSDFRIRGPGVASVSEEIFFLTNQKFVYFIHDLRYGTFIAIGKYSQSRKYLHIDYQKIEIVAIKTDNCFSDSNQFQLKTEFKIVKDKKWTNYEIHNLIESGKNLDHKRSFFLHRKRRLVLKQFTTYGEWKENACH